MFRAKAELSDAEFVDAMKRLSALAATDWSARTVDPLVSALNDAKSSTPRTSAYRPIHFLIIKLMEGGVRWHKLFYDALNRGFPSSSFGSAERYAQDQDKLWSQLHRALLELPKDDPVRAVFQPVEP